MTAAGPQAVVFVYFAGYGLQLEARTTSCRSTPRSSAIPTCPCGGSGYTISLSERLQRRIRRRASSSRRCAHESLAQAGQPLAGGLALMEPPPGMLIAFNAAPGTVAPDGQGPYGPYAQALAEMMREGGLPVGEMFILPPFHPHPMFGHLMTFTSVQLRFPHRCQSSPFPSRPRRSSPPPPPTYFCLPIWCPAKHPAFAPGSIEFACG